MSNKILFRASSVGKLMIGGSSWTAADQAALNEYEQRKAGTFILPSGNVGGLTDKMAVIMSELLKKKNAPFELGQTAKSYIESEWLRTKYGYRELIDTKEMMKGNLCEQDSIALIERVYPVDAFRIKNKRQFANDYFAGHPDIDLSLQLNRIEDVKTCWTIKTFFNTNDYPQEYYGQGQVYMDLTGARHFCLYYCLVDTPQEILTQEDKRLYFKFGGDENNVHYLEASEQLYKNHTYGNIPDELKVKKFEFDYDPEYITELKNRVEIAREYFDSLTLNNMAPVAKMIAA